MQIWKAVVNPNHNSSLTVWIDWLLALHAQEIDLGLDRIKQVAQVMGLLNPNPKVISVAGTNGKGSSVAMLSAVYRAAGYQVGAYTSPHLLHFNERIQVNGKPIEDQLIVDAFCKIEQARDETKLTYFEFATLAALVIFKQVNLDIILLEVGLGGRLDAVNIIDANLALITAIDIDHIEWLGRDINKAALEKAAIMRSGRVAICSDPDVPDTLVQYAKQHSVSLKRLGKDFKWDKKALKSSQNYQVWSFKQQGFCLENLPLPALKGDFQIQNASGVVAVVLSLSKELPVSEQHIFEGLKKTKNPGRLQSLLVKEQNWLLDVAHNPHAAGVLAEYLYQQKFYFEFAIFSVLEDKESLPMVKILSPYIKNWMIADLNIARSMSVKSLRDLLVSAGVEPENIKNFDSIELAVSQITKENTPSVLTWGSFFTVSKVMKSVNG